MMAGNDEDTVMTSKAADANGGGGTRVAMRNPCAKENRGPRQHDSHNEIAGRLAGGESGTLAIEQLGNRSIANGGAERSSINNSSENSNALNSFFTMGQQSQQRMGSVKACKKAAAGQRRKSDPHIKRWAQLTMMGTKGFDRFLHCRACVTKEARKRNESIVAPHIAHHWFCEKKKPVLGETEKAMEENIRITLRISQVMWGICRTH